MRLKFEVENVEDQFLIEELEAENETFIKQELISEEIECQMVDYEPFESQE